MVRNRTVGLWAVIVVGVMSTTTWGQVNTRQQLNQQPKLKQQGTPSNPPIATKQQNVPAPAPRTPGPTAEDWLKLLLPPPQETPQRNQAPSTPTRGRGAMDASPGRAENNINVPTVKDVQQSSSRQQQQLLRRALADLDEDLAPMPNGEGWRVHLQLEALGSGLWCQSAAEPDAVTRQRLRQVLERFRTVGADSRYQAIRGLPAFQTVQVVLPEYVMPPVEKDQRRLRTSSAVLGESLGRVKNSASWKQYLQIDQLQQFTSPSTTLELVDHDRLGEILKAYHTVEQTPAYRTIAESRGFRQTHADLRLMAESLQKMSLAAVPASSPGQGVLELRPLPQEDADRWQEILSGLFGQSDAIRRAREDEFQARKSLVVALQKRAFSKDKIGQLEDLEKEAVAAAQQWRLDQQRQSAVLRQAELALGKLSLAMQTGWVAKIDGRITLLLPLPDAWAVPEVAELLQFNDPPEADSTPMLLQFGDQPDRETSVQLLQFGDRPETAPAAELLPLGVPPKTNEPNPRGQGQNPERDDPADKD